MTDAVRQAPDRPATVYWPPRGAEAAAPFVLREGGRACRVLTHVAGGVFQVGAILAATNPGTYSRRIERDRIHRILWVMRRAGLVELVNGRGWTATADGRAALEALALGQGSA